MDLLHVPATTDLQGTELTATVTDKAGSCNRGLGSKCGQTAFRDANETFRQRKYHSRNFSPNLCDIQWNNSHFLQLNVPYVLVGKNMLAPEFFWLREKSFYHNVRWQNRHVFKPRYRRFRHGAFYLDVNECSNGQHNCHGNATCTNHIGDFSCCCNYPFYGNGTICWGK